MSTYAVARRAEQSAALQKGLAVSAGLHLTFAVLLFGAIGIARQLPPPPPPSEDPTEDHRVIDPKIFEDLGGRAPTTKPVDPPADVPVIVPVEDEEELIDDPLPPSRDVDGPTPNEVLSGTPGGKGTGERTGGTGEESDPDPNEPGFYDIQPEVIRRALPDYPEMGRQAGLEGKVTVRVLVGKMGEVKKVELENGSPLFEEAAIEAARQWTFRPALANGRPVAVWVRIPFVFRMN